MGSVRHRGWAQGLKVGYPPISISGGHLRRCPPRNPISIEVAPKKHRASSKMPLGYMQETQYPSKMTTQNEGKGVQKVWGATWRGQGRLETPRPARMRGCCRHSVPANSPQISDCIFACGVDRVAGAARLVPIAEVR